MQIVDRECTRSGTASPEAFAEKNCLGTDELFGEWLSGPWCERRSCTGLTGSYDCRGGGYACEV